MPADKPVEARLQTQQKLETMSRYWRTWAKILAQSKGPFCRSHFWFVDTMAGGGSHDSEGSPDHQVPGTALHAVIAAQASQRQFPGTTFHVRAIDKDHALAARLEALVAPMRGTPPNGVDVKVYPQDWATVVAELRNEIVGPPDHPRSHGYGPHNHVSLWLIDPWGVEPLDYRVIDSLPLRAEVIVNFDVNATRRHGGKGLDLLYRVFRDPKWQAIEHGKPEEWAGAFEEQFPAYEHRAIYALRHSGAQDRFFVQLAHHPKALETFDRAVKSGLRAGTVIAAGLLTMQQKQAIAKTMFETFKGSTLTISQIHGAGAGLNRQQLRAIAEVLDGEYGSWIPMRDTIEWFEARRERSAQRDDPTLGL